MEKKDDKIDILVLIVLFISALLVVAGAANLFGGLSGDVLIGGSIIVAGSLICRAMQWAAKE